MGRFCRRCVQPLQQHAWAAQDRLKKLPALLATEMARWLASRGSATESIVVQKKGAATRTALSDFVLNWFDMRDSLWSSHAASGGSSEQRDWLSEN